MTAVNMAIDKIINSQPKKITKLQAEKTLRDCGVLNRNNKVKKAYKSLIVENNENGKK